MCGLLHSRIWDYKTQIIERPSLYGEKHTIIADNTLPTTFQIIIIRMFINLKKIRVAYAHG